MNKNAIVLLFFILGLHCMGQDTLQGNFTNKWKADSMGVRGFRHKAVVWDCDKRKYLINGLDITKLKKKEVVSMLGTPNFKGEINHSIPFISTVFWTVNIPKRTRTISYTVNKTVTNKRHMCIKYLQIEFHKSKVYEVSLRDSC